MFHVAVLEHSTRDKRRGEMIADEKYELYKEVGASEKEYFMPLLPKERSINHLLDFLQNKLCRPSTLTAQPRVENCAIHNGLIWIRM